MAEINWYRVELDQAGKVLRVVKQSAAGADTAAVYYVQAAGQQEAGRTALKRYNAYLTRVRRHRLQKDGKCRCGRERDRLDRKYCSLCLQRNRESAQRCAAGQPDNDRSLQKQRATERRRETAQPTRLSVLLELQAELEKTSSIAAVKIWLKTQIRDARPGAWGGSRSHLRKVS